jgi:hypothetical protein
MQAAGQGSSPQDNGGFFDENRRELVSSVQAEDEQAEKGRHEIARPYEMTKKKTAF